MDATSATCAFAHLGFCPSSRFCVFVGSHPPPCRDGNNCQELSCLLSHSEPVCSGRDSCVVYLCPRRHSPLRPVPHAAYSPQVASWPLQQNQGLGQCQDESRTLEEDASMTDAESDKEGATGAERTVIRSHGSAMVCSPERRNSSKRSRGELLDTHSHGHSHGHAQQSKRATHRSEEAPCPMSPGDGAKR